MSLSRHLAPRIDFWDWQMEAACRGMGSSFFYSPSGERGLDRQAREQAATAICSGCPVREKCADFALSTRQEFGVWGGLTESDRESRRIR